MLAGLDLLIWRGRTDWFLAGRMARAIRSVPVDQGSGATNRWANQPIPVSSVQIGYYAQEHETLDYNRTLIETIRQAVRFTENVAVSFLGKFLFSYEQACSRVSTFPAVNAAGSKWRCSR